MNFLSIVMRYLSGQNEGRSGRDDGESDDTSDSGDDTSDDAPPVTPATPSETMRCLGVTPEEYVCDLLSEQGGCLRQRDVVEKTGWSKSSVSRLLSVMESDGLVVRVRVGREKVVGLPGAIPGSLVSDDE